MAPPCSPATAPGASPNRRSTVSIGRPVTMASAPWSAVLRVVNAAGSPGGTTTASGVGAMSIKVPSISSSNAARWKGGRVSMLRAAGNAQVVDRMLHHRHRGFVLQHPAVEARRVGVAVGDCQECGGVGRLIGGTDNTGPGGDGQ